MCNEIVKQLCDYAIKESEYVAYYGEEPKKSVINNWKQLFIAGIPFEDNAVGVVDIVQTPKDEEIESIVQLEIERQDKIDKQDFQNYIEFEPPWQLDNIDVDENVLSEMKCGLNIIGYIVQRILETKYPLPPIPEAPNLPKMEVAVCINAFYDFSSMPILRKLLAHKHYEIFEIQDVINFCINAYNNEMTMDAVETCDAPEMKSMDSNKIKKGRKLKVKSTSEHQIQVQDSNSKAAAEKLEKKVQTPKYFPWEEVALSPEAELGKIAEEELANGETLTDFLLIAMFVEYLKSRPNMQGKNCRLILRTIHFWYTKGYRV